MKRNLSALEVAKKILEMDCTDDNVMEAEMLIRDYSKIYRRVMNDLEKKLQRDD